MVRHKLGRLATSSTVVLFLMLFIFSLLPLSAFAHAAPTRTVKVGNFLYKGFLDSGENGTHSGYAYEYLQEIAKHTGWTYEFVDASWQDSLKMLETGQIDIMGALIKTPERQDLLDYPKYPSGKSYGTLVTNLDNNILAYEDFQNFNGLAVGAMVDSQQTDYFLDYAKGHGFEPQIIYYTNQNDLNAALETGAVKAIIMNAILRQPDLRIVAQFGDDDFYFATTKGNQEILNGLNTALEKIHYANPYFDSTLNKEYFDNEINTPVSLTREELNFLKTSDAIACVYTRADDPISYYNEKTKEFKGISADLMALISQKTGLRFEYIPVDTTTEAVDMIINGNAAVLANKNQDFDWAQQRNVHLTTPYLVSDTIKVSSANSNNNIAIYDQNAQNELVGAEVDAGATVKQYKTAKECLEAVRNGDARMTLLNSTIASYYGNDPRYYELQFTQLYGNVNNTGLVVGEGANPALLSILNKALDSISSTEINQMTSNNIKTGLPSSFLTFLYGKPLDTLFLVGGILSLIIIILVILVRIKVKNAATIQKMLYTDALTGHPNDKAFNEEAKKRIDTDPEAYALVYLDLHQFKYINDTFGYKEGDLLLKNISSILNRFIRKDELFARIYADKFVLLLKGSNSQGLSDQLKKLSKNLTYLSCDAFEHVNFIFHGGIYQMHKGNDIGMARDRANYAKDTILDSFSTTFVFYDDIMRNRILSEKTLESSMQRALDAGEFVPFFQPKVNVLTGDVIGCEALVRWNHPQKGILPPVAFIPFFEKNGFIINIDFAVFKTSCQYLKEWIDRGNVAVTVSVNFSRQHIQNKQFARQLKSIADHYGIPTKYLEIEITETMELENVETAVAFANDLKQYGFQISIDDYGSGYSSISFLEKLPVDSLKLDRSFLLSAMVSPKARDIMRHLVTAVKNNGITVICEGIEEIEQRDFIISQNCLYAQGYLYAKPLPKDEFEAYLKNSNLGGLLAVDYVPTADFEQHIWSDSGGFMGHSMPGGIIACNMDETFSFYYINDNLLNRLGYSEAEFYHATDGQFLNSLHPDDRQRIIDEMDENLKVEGEYLLQYRMRKKDGSYIWIRDVSKEVLTDNNQSVMLCVCTDITDIINLQKQVAAYEKGKD